jgi:RNA recognition motif-containing protein
MNLFVSNLSPETTEQQLEKVFSEFGNINSVKIIIDPQTGLPKGFGFVEMENKFAAQEAIINLDATYLMGTIITVKEARSNKTGNNSGRQGGDRPFQKRSGGYGSRPGYGGGGNRSGGGGYNSDRGNGGGYNSDRGNSGGYNSDRSYGNRSSNYNSNNNGNYNSNNNGNYNSNGNYNNNSSYNNNNNDY